MDTVDLLFNAQRPSMNQAAPRCSPARCQRNRHRMVLHRLRCAVRRCLATGPAQKVSTVCDRSAGPQECGRTCLKTAVTGSTSGTRAPVLKAVPQRPVRSLEPTWSAILEFGQFLNDFLDRSDLCLAVFFRGMRRTELAGHFVPPSKNIFPLPRFSSWPRDLECSQAVQEVHLLCANLLVATLNLLEQGMPKQPPCEFRTPKQCNSAQTSVHKHLAQRTELFLSNLDSALGQSFYWQGAFHQFEVHDRSRYQSARGNDVDLPDLPSCSLASMMVDWKTTFAGNTEHSTSNSQLGSCGVASCVSGLVCKLKPGFSRRQSRQSTGNGKLGTGPFCQQLPLIPRRRTDWPTQALSLT